MFLLTLSCALSCRVLNNVWRKPQNRWERGYHIVNLLFSPGNSYSQTEFCPFRNNGFICTCQKVTELSMFHDFEHLCYQFCGAPDLVMKKVAWNKELTKIQPESCIPEHPRSLLLTKHSSKNSRLTLKGLFDLASAIFMLFFATTVTHESI